MRYGFCVISHNHMRICELLQNLKKKRMKKKGKIFWKSVTLNHFPSVSLNKIELIRSHNATVAMQHSAAWQL